jgi:hypothetical protein
MGDSNFEATHWCVRVKSENSDLPWSMSFTIDSLAFHLALASHRMEYPIDKGHEEDPYSTYTNFGFCT